MDTQHQLIQIYKQNKGMSGFELPCSAAPSFYSH